MANWSAEQGPPLPIRRGMDVYSADQNRYLGTVVRVWRGSTPTHAQTQSGEYAAEQVREDVAKHVLGEELGPFPTGSVGNLGPKHQAANRYYATTPRDLQPGVIFFAVRLSRPGMLNLLAPKIFIPTSAILSISMERIIVDMQLERIPEAWYQRPAVRSQVAVPEVAGRSMIS